MHARSAARGREGQVGRRGDATDIIESDVNGSPGVLWPSPSWGHVTLSATVLFGLDRTLAWLACIVFFSYSRPPVSERITAPPRGLCTILLNKTGCFVLHPRLHLACSLTLCKKVWQRRPRPFSPRLVRASQLQSDDHRTFTSRRYRGNFVQTQIIHCRCSRKRLTLGRNSKLHVKSGRSILADNMQICFLCMNTRTIYCRRFSSDYVRPSILPLLWQLYTLEWRLADGIVY